MRKIKAIVKRTDEAVGHMTWINDTLANLQKTVDGPIEWGMMLKMNGNDIGR